MKIPKRLNAAVLLDKKRLKILNLEIPKLKKYQVLVKIKYSCICGSQLMEFNGKRGKDKWLPHLFGHEASGIVISKHSSVKDLDIGSKVVLSWIKKGSKKNRNIEYIYKSKVINAGPITTFSNYSIISSDRVYKIPNNFLLSKAVLLGCALPTGFGMVMNQLKPLHGDTIFVFGLGGIGISVIATLIAYNYKNIVGVDIDKSKINLAKKIGLKKTILFNKKNIKKIISSEYNGGISSVIECTGKTEVIEFAFSLLNSKSGKLIFASHPPNGQKIKIDPHELISGKKIEGSWGGKTNLNKQLSKIIEVFNESKINLKFLTNKTYSLNQIDKAFKDMEENKVLRPIIKMIH